MYNVSLTKVHMVDTYIKKHREYCIGTKGTQLVVVLLKIEVPV
jgi:hypothetical protein